MSNDDSHCTSMYTILLSFLQGFLAVQVYCPVIFLLMLYKTFPFSITTFETLNQITLGAGRSVPLQTSVTSLTSSTIMLLLIMVADAGTRNQRKINFSSLFIYGMWTAIIVPLRHKPNKYKLNCLVWKWSSMKTKKCYFKLNLHTKLIPSTYTIQILLMEKVSLPTYPLRSALT